MYTMLYSVLHLFMVFMYLISHIHVLQRKAVRLMTDDDQFPLNPGTLPTSLFAKLELYLGNRYLYLYTNV